MLASYCLRQTSQRVVLHTSRPTLATLPQQKSADVQTETSINPSRFFSKAKTKEIRLQNLPKLEIESVESVHSNDLLEAKRIENEPKHTKTSAPVVTSTEKFSAGLSPLPPTSSIVRTGAGLFEDAKALNTSISPGVPVTAHPPPITNEEQLPSSRFSAFLRGIRSGLPFFPSRKTSSSSMNISITREYYIPLTRPSLIRLIATDSQLIDDEIDRLSFHQLCQGFDSAVVQRYHPVLNELKHLFNPLNPDDETLENRRVSYRDRLDNEYWLLQKINDLLHRANFKELPRDILVDKFILHQDSVLSSNINIQINGYDYDVLKFWILGREQMPSEGRAWWKRVLQRTTPTASNDYFKRVIVAVRVKGQDRLYLKAFRDVPLQNLTQLLPIGKLQIGNFEQQLVRFTFLLGTGTLITHLITTMANYSVPELIVGGSSLTLLLGLWSMKSYYQSKINYLSSMSRLSFYKNIASNKQLFGMIIDRAEDELSKEVLLIYMFILSKQKQNADLTTTNLELEIENWIRSKTNSEVTFNGDQSIEFLRKLGILLPEDPSRPGRLQVIPFKQTVNILPQTSRTLSEKNEEWDLIEGYDRKHFELDWKTVLNEDKLLSKGGWH